MRRGVLVCGEEEIVRKRRIEEEGRRGEGRQDRGRTMTGDLRKRRVRGYWRGGKRLGGERRRDKG